MSRTKMKFENSVENNYTRVEMWISDDFFKFNPTFDKTPWIEGKGFDATKKENQDELVRILSDLNMCTFLDHPFEPCFVVYNDKGKVLMEDYRTYTPSPDGKSTVSLLIEDEEVKKRIKHNTEFKDKLENIINED